MSNNDTPKNIGGSRTKGELNEHGAKSRANTIIRIKEVWGVSEFMDIFPKEIRPKDDLGSTTVTILRSISVLCPDLKKAQNGMLGVCRTADGSYKTFSFSQCKALADQLKEMKNMLSAGGTQSAKKKGVAPKSSAPNTPAKFDSSSAPSSPLKAKHAKKDKAQAAGQELLAFIGKTSVKPTATEDEEENSIVVDTAPRVKHKKNAKAQPPQEKQEQTLPLTPAATAPVAVMSMEGSQTPTKADTVPVAVMSKDGSQASGMATTVPVAAMSKDGSQTSDLKKPLKKAWINTTGHDSDSEESGSDDTVLPLDMVNSNAPPAKVANGGFAKAAEKPTKSRFATSKTIGRMVVPSRELVHPFSNKHQKRPDPNETSNPPTDKPAQKKKPFANLMTTTVQPKPKTSEPPKRHIQKGGDMKKGIEMDIQAELGIQKGGDMGKDIEMDTQAESSIQNVDSNKEAQPDTGISPADVVINDATTMEVAQQVEATEPSVTVTRTLLPTSPLKKRTASTMLRAAEEPNPQVERSMRARLEQHAAPYGNERAIADVLQFERVINTITQAAMESVTASSFASASGRSGQELKAEDSKAEYISLLTSFMASVEKSKGRLLEIAEREE